MVIPVCAAVSEKKRCGRSEADHDIQVAFALWRCPHGKRCPKLSHIFSVPCKVANCGKSKLEHYCNCMCHEGNTPGYHCEICDGGPLGHDFDDPDDGF